MSSEECKFHQIKLFTFLKCYTCWLKGRRAASMPHPFQKSIQ